MFSMVKHVHKSSARTNSSAARRPLWPSTFNAQDPPKMCPGGQNILEGVLFACGSRASLCSEGLITRVLMADLQMFGIGFPFILSLSLFMSVAFMNSLCCIVLQLCLLLRLQHLRSPPLLHLISGVALSLDEGRALRNGGAGRSHSIQFRKRPKVLRTAKGPFSWA